MTFSPRQHVWSGSPYETRIGFARALRSGSLISIGGTAPLGADGRTVAQGDVSAQARRCFEIIQDALKELGTDLSAVVRTRILLVNIEDWQVVGEVHGSFFSAIQPVTTFMQVVRFIDPDWLIEVEVESWVG